MNKLNYPTDITFAGILHLQCLRKVDSIFFDSTFLNVLNCRFTFTLLELLGFPQAKRYFTFNLGWCCLLFYKLYLVNVVACNFYWSGSFFLDFLSQRFWIFSSFEKTRMNKKQQAQLKFAYVYHCSFFSLSINLEAYLQHLVVLLL